MKFRVETGIGLYAGNEFICNAVPTIIGVYTAPGEEVPAVVEVQIAVGKLRPVTLAGSVESMTFAACRKALPSIQCSSQRKQKLFEDYLHAQYLSALEELQRGEEL